MNPFVKFVLVLNIGVVQADQIKRGGKHIGERVMEGRAEPLIGLRTSQ